MNRRKPLRGLARDPGIRFGCCLLGLVAALALVGPWLTVDPNQSDFTAWREPTSGAPPGPSLAHPLGTDPLFRDVLARVCHGARVSLGIALGATLLALGLGTAFGTLGATFRRAGYPRVDAAVERLVDVALAFPYLLLITAIGVAVERADALTLVMILGFTGWPGLARAVRSKTLIVQTSTYVLAAEGLGASRARIFARHVLPALAPLLVVVGTHAAGQMVMAEAVLSYLTVGIAPPDATWGRMIHEAEGQLAVAPRLLAAPGLCILVTVLGFTRLGEGLRRHLGAGTTRAKAVASFRSTLDLALIAVIAGGSAWHDARAVAPPVGAEREGAGRADGETAAPPDTVRLAVSVPVRGLDPALAYDEAAKTIDAHLFATLLTWDHEGHLRGDLARSFAVEDDGRRFRFRLRPDARFHDGAPVTAGDVKRSLERTLHPATPSPGAALYDGLTGLEAFRDDPTRGIAGIEAPDDTTVIISLDAPDAGFLSRLGLAFSAPVCPSVPSPADPGRPVPPCGAGPYRLVEATLERITLARVDPAAATTGDRPSPPARIVWDLEMPARTQRYRFERGALDVLTELSAVDAIRYLGADAWASRRFRVTRPTMSYVFLDTTRPPFDNLNLRRAVAFALDPTALERVRPGVLTAADTVLPPRFLAGPPSPDEDVAATERGGRRRHDLTAALEAMRAAGYPYDPSRGVGGYPNPIAYVTVPDTFEQAAAEIFQQQLAAIGVRVNLTLMSWASYLATINGDAPPAMGWFGWGADYPDPSTFFEPLLRGGAGHNVTGFDHPELDALLRSARRENDPANRRRIFARAEVVVAEYAPLIPVYAAQAVHLVQPRLRNYRPHPVFGVRLHTTHLATAGAGAERSR
ncbi:MAG: ABC transporter substrate-binding protein [Myxococcota bacterium]